MLPFSKPQGKRTVPKNFLLCQNSYSRGWLTTMGVVCPSSWLSPLNRAHPLFSLGVPRLAQGSGALLRPAAASLDQFQGEEMCVSEALGGRGRRSGLGRRRSKSFIARVIVVPPAIRPETAGAFHTPRYPHHCYPQGGSRVESCNMVSMVEKFKIS